jgi:tetratricopeptide (TPR) repeat protein
LIKSLLFTLILVVAAQTQLINERIRLGEEKEAWLKRDNNQALNLLLRKADSTTCSEVDYYNIGYLYYLDKNFTQAQIYLQKSLAQKTDFAYPFYIMAKILQEKGDLTGALIQLETGLKRDTGNYFLRLEYGRVLQESGKLDRAQKVFENLLDDYENRIEVRVALAGLYRRQKKYEQAINLLENDLANSLESSVMIERADIFRAMGNNQKASEILLQICHEYPNSRELLTYKDTLATVYNIKNIPPASPMPTYKYSIRPDESLDYKVTYSFMTLGWVKIRMLPAETIMNKMTYPVIFYINSNPTFSFLISLHHVYESNIDVKTMNAIQSRLYTPESGDYLVRTYFFDYDQGKFYAQIIFADGRYHYVEKYLPRRAQDSTSILYFARGVVSNNSGGIITVVIDEEYKFGYITYLNEKEKLTVQGQDIEAVKIFARADFEGVAGMNGDAWGWFTPEDPFTPLLGKFKIIVGSIHIAADEDVKK